MYKNTIGEEAEYGRHGSGMITQDSQAEDSDMEGAGNDFRITRLGEEVNGSQFSGENSRMGNFSPGIGKMKNMIERNPIF